MTTPPVAGSDRFLTMRSHSDGECGTARCCPQALCCVCVFRLIQTRKPFLEIASFTTDPTRRKGGRGRLLVTVLKCLAQEHGGDGCTMFVHSRGTKEARGFWAAMGFRGASRFTAQLADTEGGTWGWDDTEEMEQCVKHYPVPQIDLHDALMRCRGPAAFDEDSTAKLTKGAKVWAMVDHAWVAGEVVQAATAGGSTVVVSLTGKGQDAHAVRREFVRPNPLAGAAR